MLSIDVEVSFELVHLAHKSYETVPSPLSFSATVFFSEGGRLFCVAYKTYILTAVVNDHNTVTNCPEQEDLSTLSTEQHEVLVVKVI